MRKTGLFFLVFLLVSCPLHAALEADESTSDTDRKTTAKPVEPPKLTDAEQKKIDELRKKIDLKKTEINGTTWAVTLSSSDPKIKGEKDAFIFEGGTVKSENLAKRGFNPTNYTVSIPANDPDTAVWETMQTGKEGLVFIRGEWKKDSMSGNVTEQLDGGKKVKEYHFSSASKTSGAPSKSSGETMVSADSAASAEAVPGVFVSKETTAKPPKPARSSKKLSSY